MSKKYQRIVLRRRAIKQCLNEGLTTKEIAEELGVSKRTVQRDIRFIKEA